ncbi:MAG: ATP synthase F1 subunit epsilon [Planctomycetes bacterium]|nr:ATP synthase F1 subunit epsilon [Planctomycetota bacterium]
MVEATQGSAAKTFRLQVITPERVLLDTRARSVQAVAIDGMLGVLYNHAPLVTPLVPAVLEYVEDNGERRTLAVGEGFLEVVDNHVRAMVDSAERPEQIDGERAEAAKERARQRLATRGAKDVDYARAEAALRRAIARLKAVKRL